MHTRLLLALTAGAWLIMADATLADEVGATKTQAETVQTAIGDDTQESTGDPAIDPRPVPQVRKDSGVEFRRNDHSINGPGGAGRAAVPAAARPTHRTAAAAAVAPSTEPAPAIAAALSRVNPPLKTASDRNRRWLSASSRS